MAETEQAVFEGWGIVELMGHQSEIGFVKTQAFGQAVMFRIDTPELPEREYTLTVPEHSSVSGWMPVGSVVKRAAARTALERTSHRPLILISAPELKSIEQSGEDDNNFDDGSDDEGQL